jgi:hypothetical protein
VVGFGGELAVEAKESLLVGGEGLRGQQRLYKLRSARNVLVNEIPTLISTLFF